MKLYVPRTCNSSLVTLIKTKLYKDLDRVKTVTVVWPENARNEDDDIQTDSHTYYIGAMIETKYIVHGKLCLRAMMKTYLLTSAIDYNGTS